MKKKKVFDLFGKIFMALGLFFLKLLKKHRGPHETGTKTKLLLPEEKPRSFHRQVRFLMKAERS